MKGLLTLKKSAIIATVCMAVLCLPGYSEPTPEQIAERTKLLINAIEYTGNVEQAKLCIKLGANVNARVYGRPVLMMVATKGGDWKDIAELLIKAGADVNAKVKGTQFSDGETALMWVATREDCKDIAELLVKAGADVNAKDNDGKTALMWAIDAGYGGLCKETAELLIKAGADVNAKSKGNYSYGKTALMMVASKEDWKDIAELLIKAGADVNAKDKYGWTALMSAASAGNKDTAELLIKAGADMNAKDKDGETALISAAMSDHKDIAEILIKAGADSRIALIQAVKDYNKLNALKLLIKAGADVNATDSEGISVLTYAMLYGNNDAAAL
ncbi:MAG: ankyrin repeat domain-containing protein, partial [Treponemataceae bacterium]|nr:ankyrin repeat domain-containing protein [Treponemataceae bacterium]